MNKAITAIVIVLAISLGAGCAGGAGGGGIGSNSISNAQYNHVHTGMTSAQVRNLLGKPESIENSSMSGLGKSSMWTYGGPNDTSVLITLSQKMTLTQSPSGPLLVDSKTIG